MEDNSNSSLKENQRSLGYKQDTQDFSQDFRKMRNSQENSFNKGFLSVEKTNGSNSTNFSNLGQIELSGNIKIKSDPIFKDSIQFSYFEMLKQKTGSSLQLQDQQHFSKGVFDNKLKEDTSQYFDNHFIHTRQFESNFHSYFCKTNLLDNLKDNLTPLNLDTKQNFDANQSMALGQQFGLNTQVEQSIHYLWDESNLIGNNFNNIQSDQHNAQLTVQNIGQLLKNQSKKLLGQNRQNQKQSLENEIQSYDAQDDENDTENNRRLSSLALQVKKQVEQKRITTYKEVANDLVSQLRDQSSKNPEDKIKDEQNIKRRVYDALNVLISAGIISKEKKKVKCVGKSPVQGRQLNSNWKDLKKIQSELEEKTKSFEAKQNQLYNLACKLLALKNLTSRNADRAKEIQQAQQGFYNNGNQANNQQIAKKKIFLNVDEESNESDPLNYKYKFPLVVLSSSLQDSNEQIVMKQQSKKSIKIFSKSKINLQADLDILLELKLHEVNSSLAKKNLGPQIFSIMSKHKDSPFSSSIEEEKNLIRDTKLL